jgi:S-adenosylmethionine-diacylglycerol 3-amino-3-carboxypropyl transferase
MDYLMNYLMPFQENINMSNYHNYNQNPFSIPSHYKINQSPIYFAQVREDPMVELNAIKELIPLGKPLSICLIASAGDTLCSILAHPSKAEIHNIDVVDISPDQLFLTKLKLALILNYDGETVRQFLLADKMDREDFDQILYEMYCNKTIDAETYKYWIKNFHLLIKGVNQSGRFELLFKEAMHSRNFDYFFSHENLTKIFGENATGYSMNKPFPEHFKGIYKTYVKLYDNSNDNYFFRQFVHDTYASDLPIYLKSDEPIKNDTFINYHQKSMLDHLAMASKNSYDIIHLSNITDWLNPHKFCDLLNQVGYALKKGGKVILRRLNSDTCIEDYLKKYYSKYGIYNFSVKSGIFDKSHFYSEVIVITKI